MTIDVPRIETRRFLLRLPRLEDATSIFDEYAQDPQVAHFLSWKPHSSVATVSEFLDDALARCRDGKTFVWAISRDGGERVCGLIDARIHDYKVEIGYVLGRAHWRQGIMSEAIHAVADWALARPGIFRVHAVCDVDNVGSARALEKAGFEREGLLRKWLILPNVSPEPRDCYMYARTERA